MYGVDKESKLENVGGPNHFVVGNGKRTADTLSGDKQSNTGCVLLLLFHLPDKVARKNA